MWKQPSCLLLSRSWKINKRVGKNDAETLQNLLAVASLSCIYLFAILALISNCGTRNAFDPIAVPKTKQNALWWLEEGTEICPACSHTYVIQTEYRCAACDGPLCGMCVENAFETEIFCSHCVGATSN